jgi:hypothetical protein
MKDRRQDGRVRKNFELPKRHADLLAKLAEKHGLTEAGAICTAITQWADREGVLVPKQEKAS